MKGYEAVDDVVTRLPGFIDQVYNSERLHSALGYRRPIEFKTRHAWQAAEIRDSFAVERKVFTPPTAAYFGRY